MKNSAIFSQRSLVTLMAFLGLVNAFMMRLCLNMALIKWGKDGKEKNGFNFKIPVKLLFIKYTQSTMMNVNDVVEFLEPKKPSEWSGTTKGLTKSAFFIGFALIHIPGSFLGQKYGGKTIFSIGLFFTAICSLLTPIVTTYTSADGLIVLRFLMGVGEAPVHPALIYLLSCWIPKKERSRVSSIVFTGGQIGSAICNLVTGYVLQYIPGAEPIFYISGGIGIVWNIAFNLLVFNTPSTHPRISAKEKEYLQNEIGDLVATKTFSQIPWTSMLTSAAVWSLIIAVMGHDFGFYTLVMAMPNYLSAILELDYEELAWYTSIPFLVSFLSSLLYGAVCDYIVISKIVTVIGARRIFTAIGALVCATFTISIYYAAYNSIAVLICFSLAMGSISAFYSGAQANLLDICPNYSGALMGLVKTAGAFCGFVVPYLTGFLTEKGQYRDWEPVFWISFVVLSITLVAYMIWGTAEVQSWNDNIVEDNCLKRTWKRFFPRKVEKVESENKLNEIVRADVPVEDDDKFAEADNKF